MRVDLRSLVLGLLVAVTAACPSEPEPQRDAGTTESADAGIDATDAGILSHDGGATFRDAGAHTDDAGATVEDGGVLIDAGNVDGPVILGFEPSTVVAEDGSQDSSHFALSWEVVDEPGTSCRLSASAADIAAEDISFGIHENVAFADTMTFRSRITTPPNESPVGRATFNLVCTDINNRETLAEVEFFAWPTFDAPISNLTSGRPAVVVEPTIALRQWPTDQGELNVELPPATLGRLRLLDDEMSAAPLPPIRVHGTAHLSVVAFSNHLAAEGLDLSDINVVDTVTLNLENLAFETVQLPAGANVLTLGRATLDEDISIPVLHGLTTLNVTYTYSVKTIHIAQDLGGVDLRLFVHDELEFVDAHATEPLSHIQVGYADRLCPAQEALLRQLPVLDDNREFFDNGTECVGCLAGEWASVETTCVEYDACALNPCASFLTCSDEPAPSFSYTCDVDCDGPDAHAAFCDLPTTCSAGACFSGASCADAANGAVCGECPAGYVGDGATCVFSHPLEQLGGYVCYLNPDGTPYCFGDVGDSVGADTQRQLRAPATRLVQLAAYTPTFGLIGMCGLDALGALHCWGPMPRDRIPAVRFSKIDGGHEAICGLTQSGEARCVTVSADEWGLTETPPGPFTDIAVGEDFACALTPAGAVTCWGFAFSFLSGLTGTYEHLFAAKGVVCGQFDDGSLDCSSVNQVNGVLPGEHRLVHGTISSVQFVGPDGLTRDTRDGLTTPNVSVPSNAIALGSLRQRNRFSGGPCVFTDAGSYVCPDSAPYIPGGNMALHPIRNMQSGARNWAVDVMTSRAVYFAHVSTTSLEIPSTLALRRVIGTGLQACTLDDAGDIACWGSHGFAGNLADNFLTGQDYQDIQYYSDKGLCALDGTGVVDCWHVHDGTFIHTDVEQLAQEGCFRRTDGTLGCSVPTASVEALPANETYTDLSIYYGDACAITTTGALFCNDGEIGGGPYRDVELGGYGRCAVRADDDGIRCWGMLYAYSGASIYAGPVSELAVGGDTACATDLEGLVHCWGRHEFGLD